MTRSLPTRPRFGRGLAVFAAALAAAASSAQTTGAPAASPQDRFFTAARRGDVVEMKKLLDSGVDVNTPFRYGATALSYACDRGHVDSVRLLLDRGAKTDVRDTFYGASAFDWALNPAQGDHGDAHTEIVRLFLAKGAGSREQALSAGVSMKRAALVKVALEGAPHHPLDLGDALEAAKTANAADVVALLEAAGAKPNPEPKAVVAPERLKRYAGEWVSAGARPQTLVITATETGLTMPAGPSVVITFAAHDDWTFRSTSGQARLRLTFVEKDGVVTGMRFKNPGGVSEFKRK